MKRPNAAYLETLTDSTQQYIAELEAVATRLRDSIRQRNNQIKALEDDATTWRQMYDEAAEAARGGMMDIAKIKKCSFLLPAPGGEVVRELADEIERLRTAARTALDTCQAGMTPLVADGVDAQTTNAAAEQFAAAWRDLRSAVEAAEATKDK